MGEFKVAVNHLRHIPELRLSLQVVPFINGLFTIISMLVVLSLSTYPDFSPYTSVQTIALVNMAYILGMIAGSFLVMRYLAKVAMESLLKIGTLILTLVFVGLQFQMFHLLVFSLFIGDVLIGAGDPKFNALLYRVVPSDKLATISGGVMTYFYLGMILVRLLVSVLMLWLSPWLIVVILLALALGLFSYTSCWHKGNSF